MKNNVNEKREKNFLINGADGGTAFTIAVFVPLIITVIVSAVLMGTGLTKDEEFMKGATYQYLSFLTTTVALGICLLYFLLRRKLNFALTLGFKKFKPIYLAIALLLCFGALFGLSWINEAFINLLKKIGFNVPSPQVPNRGTGDYFLCLLIICILPAFFEECIFRGVILNGASRIGDVFCILLTGAMFSLYHGNPAQTIYQFIMGATFALITLKSGSIIPSMLIHFLNNAMIITDYFFIHAVFPLSVKIVLGVLGILCFIGGVLILVFLCHKPEKDRELAEGYQKIVEVKNERKMFILMSLAGIVGCVILWISNLVSALGA